MELPRVGNHWLLSHQHKAQGPNILGTALPATALPPPPTACAQANSTALSIYMEGQNTQKWMEAMFFQGMPGHTPSRHLPSRPRSGVPLGCRPPPNHLHDFGGTIQPFSPSPKTPPFCLRICNPVKSSGLQRKHTGCLAFSHHRICWSNVPHKIRFIWIYIAQKARVFLYTPDTQQVIHYELIIYYPLLYIIYVILSVAYCVVHIAHCVLHNKLYFMQCI